MSAGLLKLSLLLDRAVDEVGDEKYTGFIERRRSKAKARRWLRDNSDATLFYLKARTDELVSELLDENPQLASSVPVGEGETPILDWFFKVFQWMEQNQIVARLLEVIKQFIQAIFDMIDVVPTPVT